MNSDLHHFILGVARDIASIKNTQKLLADSEARYEIAVKGLAVGLWDFAVQKESLFWSDRFKAMVGVDDNSFAGLLSRVTWWAHWRSGC